MTAPDSKPRCKTVTTPSCTIVCMLPDKARGEAFRRIVTYPNGDSFVWTRMWDRGEKP